MSTASAHLFFRRVRLLARGPHFSLELGSGAHAVVVGSLEEAQAFVASAIGIEEPQRGRVAYGRTRPGHSPSLRSQLGSLLPNEPALHRGGSTQDHVEHVLALRKQLGVPGAQTAADVPLVAKLLARPARDLPPNERRRVALGLALALERPVALVLHDPLSGLSDEETELVSQHLKAHAESPIPVVCTTFTERSGRRITERVHQVAEPSERTTDSAHFLVRAERPREIAALLSQSPDIVALRIHPEIEGELSIEAVDESAGAEIITRVVCQSGVEVFEMRRVSRTVGGGNP